MGMVNLVSDLGRRKTRKMSVPWWFTLGCMAVLGFGVFLVVASLAHRHWFTFAGGILFIAMGVMWNRFLGPALFSEMRGEPRTPRGRISS